MTPLRRSTAKAHPSPCFVAMPSGKKAPPGKRQPVVDFDRVANIAQRAVEAEKLESVRAKVDASGVFVHREMLERLIVADHVIADLTFGSASVMYAVGLRHGASERPTIVLCVDSFVDALPFDAEAFGVIPYSVTAAGALTKASAERLTAGLRERLRRDRKDDHRGEHTLVELTARHQRGVTAHEKIDRFLQRLAEMGKVGARVTAAMRRADASEAVAELGEIERELLRGGANSPLLHTALLGIYIGYRERKAYDEMLELYGRMPRELQHTIVAREQRALALNRLAEADDARATKELRQSGNADRNLAAALRREAEEWRANALDTLELIPLAARTSETHAIRGRIYKGAFDAASDSGDGERAGEMLSAAIDAYEAGVRADMRDSLPGVNAVTLRLRRGSREDLGKVEELARVVRLAVETAPPPHNDEERYWQTATRLELASAARDWDRAKQELEALLAIPGTKGWMRETTAKNLRIQLGAFRDDGRASAELERYVTELTGPGG